MTTQQSNSDGPGAVVITGASRGIGRATALYLGAAGFRVFAGVRSAEDGARVEAEGGGRVRSLILDVTDGESIARAEAEVSEAVSPSGLAGLVNNAAGGLGGPLEHVSLRDMEQVFALNVHGVLQTTQAFLPLLRRGRGRLVNIGGGGAGYLAIPLQGLVSASKYAIEGMTDALRVELRGSGVRVCLVEPGMTYSEEDKPIFRAGHERAVRSGLGSRSRGTERALRACDRAGQSLQRGFPRPGRPAGSDRPSHPPAPSARVVRARAIGAGKRPSSVWRSASSPRRLFATLFGAGFSACRRP